MELMDYIYFWLFMSALITFLMWIGGLYALSFEEPENVRMMFRFSFLSWLWPLFMVGGLVWVVGMVLLFTFGLDNASREKRRLRKAEKSARLSA